MAKAKPKTKTYKAYAVFDGNRISHISSTKSPAVNYQLCMNRFYGQILKIEQVTVTRQKEVRRGS